MTINDWISILVPVVVAALASLPGLMAYLDQVRRAQGRGDALKTYKALVDEQVVEWERQHSRNLELQQEIDALRDEIGCWRDVLRRWQAGIKLLINQVVSTGRTPVWEPSEDDIRCIEKKGDGKV